MARIKSVLMVCSGNVARSVIAEHLLKKILSSDQALRGVKCTSAGTGAIEGQAASSKVAAVMGKKDIDVSGHVAKPVTKQLLQTADLVLVMTTEHRDFISREFPEATSKTFTLKEFAGEKDLDIQEPLGVSNSIESYRQLANEIEKSLMRVALKLRSLVA